MKYPLIEIAEDCAYEKIKKARMNEDKWYDMDDAHKRREKKKRRL
jgi:hypothetical protein